MGDKEFCEHKTRTNVGKRGEENEEVWEQLLRQAKDGDLKAIKLYYDMLEKKQRKNTSSESAKIEQMAQIRRAVFGEAMTLEDDGDDTVDEDSS